MSEPPAPPPKPFTPRKPQPPTDEMLCERCGAGMRRTAAAGKVGAPR